MRCRLFVLVVFLICCITTNLAQGTWTWKWGAVGSPNKNIATVGTYSALNNPGARYAGVCWEDPNGIFWMYGGAGEGDVWKYNPIINQWAIMHNGSVGVYGTTGIPNIANTPGPVSFGHPAWADSQGYLWIYSPGSSDDLWNYNTTTNMWTHIKGSQLASTFAVYGTQGVPAPNVSPGIVNETDCKWVDSNDNLWLFNEFDGVLWKYDPLINQWTWVKGVPLGAPVYGTLGAFAPGNSPGTFAACPSVGTLYCMWQDSNDNLWMIVNRIGATVDAEIWQYSMSLNQWACMRRDISSFGAAQINYGTQCVESSTAFPVPRTEFRVRWVDDCDNLWIYGGAGLCMSGSDNGDIWKYTPTTNNWTWIKGTTTGPVYGTQGVANPTNQPSPGRGQQHWKNNDGFWLHGGDGTLEMHHVWMYKADTVVANFNFIANSCLQYNFTDLSTSGCNTIKSYSWNFGDPSSGSLNVDTLPNPSHTFSGSGSYQVTLIVTNCTSDSDTITQTINLNCGLNVTLNSDTICEGDCVNLTVIATGGVPNYSFQWNQGITGTGSGPYNVCPTTTTNYTVIVMDSIGDKDTATSTITVLTQPVVNLGNDTNICGSTNFILDAQNPGLSYLWSNSSTNQTLSINQSGTYWVTVNNGVCTSSDTINVTFNSLNLNLGNDIILCEGDSTLLDANITGVTYNWSTGETSQQINVTSNGLYWLTVISGPCVVSDTIQVLFTKPIALFSPSDTSGCPPLTVNFSDLSLAGAQSNINTWLWNFGDNTTSNNQNPSHSYNNQGNYIVNLFVTDSLGCKDDTNMNISVNVFPIPQASFSFTPETVELSNPRVQFIDNSVGAISWLWDFGNGITSTVQNPIHKYQSSGTYTVTLTVINQYGCESTISYTLIVQAPFNIYLPNTFTPNGNGVNDVFKPKGEGILEYHLMIYDRWGELIFESNNIDIGWDGTYKGVAIESETYVWKLNVKSIEPKNYNLVGHVNLLR